MSLAQCEASIAAARSAPEGSAREAHIRTARAALERVRRENYKRSDEAVRARLYWAESVLSAIEFEPYVGSATKHRIARHRNK